MSMSTSDVQTAQRSRRVTLQLAASKHIRVGGAHISFPGLGHIGANGEKFE